MVRDLRVRTAQVESRPGGDGVTLLGELQVNQDGYAEVGTPVEGRVVRLARGAGDVVEGRGARWSRSRASTLGEARAAEATARARAELARQAVERKRRLVADESPPGPRAGRGRGRGARRPRPSCGRRAPRCGRSAPGAPAARRWRPLRPARADRRHGARAERRARPDRRSRAQPLFRIADLKVLWLTVHAFERDALRLKPGSAARVTFPALPGRTFAGKVTWIGSQVDVTSRTIPVRVTVANADGRAATGHVGHRLRCRWATPAGSVVAVPMAAAAAAGRRLGGVPPRQGGTQLRDPPGGPRAATWAARWRSCPGLQAGETVVVDGAFLLKAEAEKARGMGEHHEH